jgi:hypothetical protein
VDLVQGYQILASRAYEKWTKDEYEKMKAALGKDPTELTRALFR